jgi:hypothetical protein
MVRFGRILPLVLCFAASTADAEPETSPITDSNYSIELYDGVAIGNTAVVGMGGATVALAIGTSGTLFNPSAPAVKPTTDTDKWSWDYHLDYLNGTLSTDYDNNGILAESGTSVLTLGFGLRIGEWAGAITATSQYVPVDAMYTLPNGNMVPLVASALRVQFAVAHWVKRLDTAIGISSQAARFALAPDCSEDGCYNLFTVGGGGLELGATWAPRRQSFRIGAAVASPIAGGDTTSNCDPMDCVGWILPEKVVSPWRLAVGTAYRFSGSDWNQLVGGYFRDEKSLTLAADVVITGSSENAFGLEAFGQHELQRSGRHPSFSVRGGAELEYLPGRLRIRGGSYWEPGRFVGVSGRLHGTFGIEVRVFQFWFWGTQRRGRISLTADFAARYRNGGLSVGFWH